jgi:hypothetical protein
MNVFDNIHELCGPVMHERINTTVKKEIEEYNMKFEHNYATDVEKYRTELLSMTDDEFNAIYRAIYLLENKDIKDLNLNYICAILSDTTLIKKCINTLNEVLKRIDPIYNINSMITLESIMLLAAHNFDNVVLLLLAYYALDYISMKYIINIMSIDELKTIVYDNSDVYRVISCIGIVEILLMDKLFEFGHSYVSKMHDNYNRFISGHKVLLRRLSINEVIVECYYIIRYMTQAEGKIHMTKRNESYKELIDYPGNRIPSTTIYNVYELYNSLLEYHFRPRGYHTKSAIHS